MTDRTARELERQAASGDLDAEAGVLRSRMRRGELSLEQVELAAYVLDPIAWKALGWPGEPGRAMVKGRLIKVPGGIEPWLRGIPHAGPRGHRAIDTECPPCRGLNTNTLGCGACYGSGFERTVISNHREIAIRVQLAMTKAGMHWSTSIKQDQEAIRSVERWLADPSDYHLQQCHWFAHSGESKWCEHMLLHVSRGRNQATGNFPGRDDDRLSNSRHCLMLGKNNSERHKRVRQYIHDEIAPWALRKESFA